MQEFNLTISFLSISFINSDRLRDVNKEYLKHDYETDVITFNYSKKMKDIDGEILISFEEADRNSKKYKVTYGKELSRLVIHGMLHLLNFDDKNTKSKKIMKRMENKLILSYNFTLFACK
jgi:rRNA maturation RNase YbeY